MGCVGSVTLEKVIAHHGDENEDLGRQPAGSDAKRVEELLQLGVVVIPKSIQVVGQPPEHFPEVVANCVQPLLEPGTHQGEDELVALGQQDVDARAD